MSTCLPTIVPLYYRREFLSLHYNNANRKAPPSYSTLSIQVLSQLPALRELNLAFNYFTRVNFAPKFAEHAFPLLEGLDLGFNYISSEDDVVVLVFLERLQRIILYGNPLTGPTGEDSSGLCVEGIVDKAYRCELLL